MQYKPTGLPRSHLALLENVPPRPASDRIPGSPRARVERANLVNRRTQLIARCLGAALASTLVIATALIAVPSDAKVPRAPHRHSSSIESLAGYSPQRKCSPWAKPGTTAFANLLRNAVQASPGGRVRVSWSGGGTDVTFIIEDDGPGLFPEIRARIFEPFFTTKGALGTGLGLSVVQRIAHEHGGSVVAGDSELGGAAFHLILPSTSCSPRTTPPGRRER